MRKKLVRLFRLISAATAIAAAAAFYMLDRYWVVIRGGQLWSAGYVFSAAALVIIIVAAASVFAFVLADSIIRPLERSEDDYVELDFLKRRLDAQSSRLKYSNDELEEKERNLSLVVENMSQGLILIDRRGIVMMMNASAGSLLGADPGEHTGRHIFAVSPQRELQAAVHQALGGQPAHETIEQGDNIVEIDVNPVVVEKVIRGAVVFISDATERQAAERMRREFSANVSHELKTPLTSLSGYAELLKEGMVKPEDVVWTATKIYDEAQRLISLTDDIMRLSCLDEGGTDISMEPVSLLDIARGAAERLHDKAGKYGVTVTVGGDSGPVCGNAPLLDEMVFNLCDNSIKYNRPGGRVDITVLSDGDSVVLTVADTGVGIPREHQDRVFERFYRVDKSHSKATGGTGLGLSIVKNGAAFHRARIELQSRPGEGTTIRLRFARRDPENPQGKDTDK